MPLNASRFKTEDARCLMNWDDETILIHYERDKYTTEYINSNPMATSEEMLAHIASKWDVFDDLGIVVPKEEWESTGKPPMWPLTVEALNKLPSGFVATALRTITDDQRPNQLRSRQPTNTSSQEE
jgi:hypothetical protein